MFICYRIFNHVDHHLCLSGAQISPRGRKTCRDGHQPCKYYVSAKKLAILADQCEIPKIIICICESIRLCSRSHPISPRRCSQLTYCPYQSKMGVIATLKNNKVGAVVVSVFDWYRSFSMFDIEGYGLTIMQRRSIPKKRGNFFASLISPSWSSDL